MSYANDHAKHDGLLKVHFIGHPADIGHKSDAFLIEYDGYYLLIDGGLPEAYSTCEYLKNIHAGLVEGHDKSDKLKISWLATHFHRDHVCATIEHIIPADFIEVEKIYLPPDSVIAGKYSSNEQDGDAKYRPKLLDAIKKHSPGAEIINFDFGKEGTRMFEIGRLKLTVMPPVRDLGEEKNVKDLIALYNCDEVSASNISTLVMNSSALWILAKFGRHKFLFTGDTVKKSPDLYESLDEMVDVYADEIGKVNVLKFPHHGFKRNDAFDVMKRFHAGWTVLTTHKETLTESLKERGINPHTRFINCGLDTYVFETDGQKMNVRKIRNNF